MSEIEVPMEKIHEDIHEAIEHAEHGGHGGHGEGGGKSFMNIAAIMSAFLAVAAAISALFAGGYANEAMMEQIQSSDQWALYQAKGIKAAIADLKFATTKVEADSAKTETYKKEQEEIKEKAESREQASENHLKTHETLAASVTFFQVAIALTAIAVLARRRQFLWGSVGLGILGLIWMAKGFLTH
jgi:hypothetical protein